MNGWMDDETANMATDCMMIHNIEFAKSGANKTSHHNHLLHCLARSFRTYSSPDIYTPMFILYIYKKIVKNSIFNSYAYATVGGDGQMSVCVCINITFSQYMNE